MYYQVAVRHGALFRCSAAVVDIFAESSTNGLYYATINRGLFSELAWNFHRAVLSYTTSYGFVVCTGRGFRRGVFAVLGLT